MSLFTVWTAPSPYLSGDESFQNWLCRDRWKKIPLKMGDGFKRGWVILKRGMTCVIHKVLSINWSPGWNVVTGCTCIACKKTMPYLEELSREHELAVYVIKLQLLNMTTRRDHQKGQATFNHQVSINFWYSFQGWVDHIITYWFLTWLSLTHLSPVLHFI